VNEIVKDRVRELMRIKPCTRDDDFVLWLEYIYRFYKCAVDDSGHLIPEFLHAVPTQHTLARHRATVQNVEGQFLPTCLQVALDRRIAADAWKRWITAEIVKVQTP
jgi:hypothetical protein